MLGQVLCYVIFFLVESILILGSLVVVLCFYFPYVALKGMTLAVMGKAVSALPNQASGSTAHHHA